MVPDPGYCLSHSHSAAGDENKAGNEGNRDLSDEDIKICLFMSHLADTRQGDLRALVRQCIQSTGRDGGDPVDMLEVGTEFYIGVLKRVEGNAHTAGSGAAGTCADRDSQHGEYKGRNIRTNI